MNGPLVEFEIVDSVGRLSNTLTVVSEARTAVNLRDGPLHEVTLVAHKLAARAITSHGGDSSAEGSSVLLHTRS